jgi:enterochelin esterase-like enzyme
MKKPVIILMALAFNGILYSQQVKVASGRVQRFENFKSRYVASRDVDVWLPDGYTSSKKYAVLYMHDGQMLFDSSSNWNHQEWCVDETAGKLIKKKKIRACIVVGISNGGELRHCEYLPQKAFETLPETGQDFILTWKRNGKTLFPEKVMSNSYLDFLVKELKPFIDSAFSTRADISNTFVAGSSMGGLISLYAICEYPGVFGGAACLSTHWTGIFTAENNPFPRAMMNYLQTHLPDPSTHRIYFDHGDKTLDTLYQPFQQQADAIMKEKGYTSANWMTLKFPGENHTEKAWAKRFYIPLEFLLKSEH